LPQCSLQSSGRVHSVTTRTIEKKRDVALGIDNNLHSDGNFYTMSQARSQTQSQPWLKEDFSFFETITLRWADNDAYGHINNAHYYSFFDTAVDGFLLQHSLRSLISGQYQTLVVASECRYFSQVSAPGIIRVGVRPGRLGRSSTTYEVAVFTDASDQAAAQGLFVHVCVDKNSQRPTETPENFRAALQALIAGQ
jgi:acyl-CoA thioester hydrolase